MKYSTAQIGRTFVIRLEDGEILHEQLENFAQEHSIKAASVTAFGGADTGSVLVVGPEVTRSDAVVPMEYCLTGAHEVTGVGTIFLNASGKPILHMHLACGRKGKTRTGCVRKGVKVWHVMEVIITELTGTSAKRLKDEKTGFELLDPLG